MAATRLQICLSRNAVLSAQGESDGRQMPCTGKGYNSSISFVYVVMLLSDRIASFRPRSGSGREQGLHQPIPRLLPGPTSLRRGHRIYSSSSESIALQCGTVPGRRQLAVPSRRPRHSNGSNAGPHWLSVALPQAGRAKAGASSFCILREEFRLRSGPGHNRVGCSFHPQYGDGTWHRGKSTLRSHKVAVANDTCDNVRDSQHTLVMASTGCRLTWSGRTPHSCRAA